MTMDDKMSALISRETLELVDVPPKADIVACLFTLKFRADGNLNGIKLVWLQKVSLRPNLNWPVYQMDIKNVFVYGDLNEIVYMEQPPDYVAQGEKQFYVDDILIIGSDIVGIEETKTYLQKYFVTKDLGRPRSSVEAEYQAMAHTTSEVLWLKNLLKELGFMYDDPVPMHCGNQVAIHIASNPVFMR
ncbi:hypothetical protein Sango_2593900 [Sesamum angolense]|uniref:Reverse transcriptase Ty1/copia-type domain-containing protein n=1 Tax=Sesamum angolense TaxID=2727404 RepID=A0AAE1W5M1_9LAMI|nr:hypothetical protein Sango_2593900 [Sesamum angolense]